MIENKILHKFFKHYIEALLGPLGQSDVKYKGHFTLTFPVPLANFGAAWEHEEPELVQFNPLEHRLEIRTRFISSIMQYEIHTTYIWGDKSFLSKFLISGEAFSYHALTHHFREVHKEFQQEGLINLTPEEEAAAHYAEAKKQMMAAAYGFNSGKFDMALLKKELDNVKMPTWLVQGPNGNMHVANPDAGSQVLHNIMAQVDAAKAKEIHMSMSTFDQVKKLAEKHFKEHGEFPNPNSFVGVGMKVAIDPAVPDGAVVFHTAQPPLQQKPKNVESYGNSGNELAKLIPALSASGIPCPEPASCETGWNSYASLSDLIIHLNDHHRWPRSGTDPNPRNKPNIADWIDEICLIHGLDQSFHPKKQTPNDPRGVKKEEKNTKIKGGLVKSIVDEPVVIDEEWLSKYEQKLIKGFADKYLKFPKLKGWINDGDQD